MVVTSDQDIKRFTDIVEQVVSKQLDAWGNKVESSLNQSLKEELDQLAKRLHGGEFGNVVPVRPSRSADRPIRENTIDRLKAGIREGKKENHLQEKEGFSKVPSEDQSDGIHTPREGAVRDLGMRATQPEAVADTMYQSITEGFLRDRNEPCSVQNFVHGDFFDQSIAVFVLLNTIYIGVETDWMARNGQLHDPPFFQMCNYVFCAVFVLEIVLRVYADGWRHHAAVHWKWFLFNLVLVILQLSDEAIKVAMRVDPEMQGTSQLVSLCRGLRILRIFRLLDRLHFVDELRLMITSIKGSMKSLGCSIFVMFAFTYVIGVPLTLMVNNFKVKNEESHPEAVEELDKFYGDLSKSMMSLFQSVSDGIHWRELMVPLSENCSVWWEVAFVFYISFVVFAMMNILTGIFVESAMMTADHEKKNGILQESMRRLFETCDLDGSGSITYDEFDHQIQSNYEMKDYLHMLDIGEDRARDLFLLLDNDSSGCIDCEEFVAGCVRLEGSAKAIDFATFINEWTEFREKFEQLMTGAHSQPLQRRVT